MLLTVDNCIMANHLKGECIDNIQESVNPLCRYFKAGNNQLFLQVIN